MLRSPGPPRVFRPFFLVGAGMMAGGVVGLLADARDTHPTDWVGWFLAGLVAHDLVIAPIVFVLGALVAHRIKAPYRAPIQGGLFTSAVVVLFSLPLVRGYGRAPSNPSALPNDYGRNMVFVLALVWIVVAIATYRSRRRSKKSS